MASGTFFAAGSNSRVDLSPPAWWRCSMATDYSAPDLNIHPPRSPRVRMGGYVWLARLIDKARAARAGKLGSYLWANPMDLVFLKYTGLDADAFLAGTGGTATDREALDWFTKNAAKRAPWDLTAWSTWFENLVPFSNERRERFNMRAGQAAAAEREDIATWFDYLDVDDFFTFGGEPAANGAPPACAPGAVNWMAPDLSVHAPRSPRVRLGGYVILARILDKARASLRGATGDYHYACPLDRRWFEFTGISADALKAEAGRGLSDGELIAWVQNNTACQPHEILAWNAAREQAVPSDNESREYVSSLMTGARAAHREDIGTWFEALDVDDFATFGGQP